MFNMYHWMNWQGMYFLEKSLERSLDRFLEMTKVIYFLPLKNACLVPKSPTVAATADKV